MLQLDRTGKILVSVGIATFLLAMMVRPGCSAFTPQPNDPPKGCDPSEGCNHGSR